MLVCGLVSVCLLGLSDSFVMVGLIVFDAMFGRI